MVCEVTDTISFTSLCILFESIKTRREMQQQQMINSVPVGAVPHESALVYMPVPIRSTTYDRYQSKQSIGLGVTQIIIGILCIIFNIVCIRVVYDYDNLAFIGHGFWCGILFILNGGLGVGAGIKKTRCLIVTFMVMCIISATTTISLLAIGISGACIAADYCEYNYDYGYSYPGYYNPPCERMSGYNVVVAMEALMAILGFIAGFTSIWGSALCCGSGVCCCSHSTPFPVYYQNNGQMLYLNQSQTGQNLYLPQPPYSYSQGMMAPPYVPNYAQPAGWAMPPPINISDPLIGQAPPQYPATLQLTSAQAQSTDERKF